MKQNFDVSLFLPNLLIEPNKHILKFQSNWTLHRRDIASLQVLIFGLHNRGAVGKIFGKLSET